MDCWDLYALASARSEAPPPPPLEEDPERCDSCGKGRALCVDYVQGDVSCRFCGHVQESGLMLEQPTYFCGENEAYVPVETKTESRLKTKTDRLKVKVKKRASACSGSVDEALTTITDRLELPKTVTNQAKEYFERLSERKVTRGRVRQGLLGCCVLHVCREMHMSRTVEDVAGVMDVSSVLLNKSNKVYTRLMNEELVRNKPETMRPTVSGDLLNRMCVELMDEIIPHADRVTLQRTKKRVLGASRRLDERVSASNRMDNRTPRAVACAVLHAACKETGLAVTKSDVSRVFRVSVATVSKMDQMIRTL